jgi:flagellar motor switch protein FliM
MLLIRDILDSCAPLSELVKGQILKIFKQYFLSRVHVDIKNQNKYRRKVEKLISTVQVQVHSKVHKIVCLIIQHYNNSNVDNQLTNQTCFDG